MEKLSEEEIAVLATGRILQDVVPRCRAAAAPGEGEAGTGVENASSLREIGSTKIADCEKEGRRSRIMEPTERGRGT